MILGLCSVMANVMVDAGIDVMFGFGLVVVVIVVIVAVWRCEVGYLAMVVVVMLRWWE